MINKRIYLPRSCIKSLFRQIEIAKAKNLSVESSHKALIWADRNDKNKEYICIKGM